MATSSGVGAPEHLMTDKRRPRVDISFGGQTWHGQTGYKDMPRMRWVWNDDDVDNERENADDVDTAKISREDGA